MLRESEKRSFIRAYLERRKELKGCNDPVQDDEVKNLLDITRVAELVKCLYIFFNNSHQFSW